MQETFDRHIFFLSSDTVLLLWNKNDIHTGGVVAAYGDFYHILFHISSLAHKIEFKVPVAYSWLQPPPAVASLSSRKTSVCIRINVRKKGSRKTFLSW